LKVWFLSKVAVEYAVLNDAQPTAAVPGSDMGEVSPGIDRSDDRFKDLPRDATIKELLGRKIWGLKHMKNQDKLGLEYQVITY
jgi:hypothetical protein